MKARMMALLALAIALPVTASAQCTPETAGKMPPGPGQPAFSEFDLNGDGSIVSAEFYEARGKRMADRAKAGGKLKNAADAPIFEDIDTDSDGKITPDEFAAHQAEERTKRGPGHS